MVHGSILPDGTRVDDFLIGRFPVTELQWKNVIGKSTVKHEINGDDFPIVGVHLLECVEFIREFNSQTGRKAFLPSLTQWKYAAQGGNVSKNYKYAGSDNLDEVGWYKQNSDNQLHPIGKKKPNELGIYDMSGNVWEYATGFSNDILYDATNRTVKEAKEWNLAIKELNQLMQLEAYALGVVIPKYNLPNLKTIVVGGGYRSPSTHCRIISKKTIEKPNNSMGFRIVINLDNDGDK